MADHAQKRKLGDIYAALGPKYKKDIDRIAKRHYGISVSECNLVDEDFLLMYSNLKKKRRSLKKIRETFD